VSKPSNVIDLSEYRQKRTYSQYRNIMYLSNSGSWGSLLNSFRALKIRDIQNHEMLRDQLKTQNPDLILLESNLVWANAIEMAHYLDNRIGVPIVFIVESKSKSNSRKNLKRAYSAGVCDTLFTPLNKEEVAETIGVLLKFQERISLYH